MRTSIAAREGEVMCHECKGRGWRWAGVLDNADRVECEPCAGTGVERSYLWLPICALASWALALGAIWLLQSAVTQIVN